LRSIQPPSTTSRSLIRIGKPGHQVICSTGWFLSSQVLGAIVMGLPLLSRFGCPLFVSTGTRSRRAFTDDAGQGSRQGVKM
jgi:hypothetical protein